MPLLARKLLPIVLVVVFLLGCANDGEPSEGESSQSADLEVLEGGEAEEADELAGVVEEFVGDEPGGADMLFVRDGESIRTVVGIASSDGTSLEAGMVFRVGSIAKPFVAVMVLQLVDEGEIDLDATLDTYLPDTPLGGDATIRSLLAHESGIANYTEHPDFFADVLADPTARFAPEEMLAYAADVDAGDVDSFAYSNTNFILLGQLIETVTGNDLNAALRDRIALPLGLDNTMFDDGQEGGAAPVGGWSEDVLAGDPDEPYAAVASSAWSAGSLVSTVDDLSVFLHALADGDLVSDDSFAAMTDFGVAGNGLGLVQASLAPTQVGFGHSGGIPGFSSTMVIDPDSGDTLIILTNNDELVADALALQILASS